MKIYKKIALTLLIVNLCTQSYSHSIPRLTDLYTMHFSIVENVPVKNYRSINWDAYLVYTLHLLYDSGYTKNQIYNCIYDEIVSSSFDEKCNNKYTYNYQHFGAPFAKQSKKVGTNTQIVKSLNQTSNYNSIQFDETNIKKLPVNRLNKIKIPIEVSLYYKQDKSEKYKRIASVIKVYWWVKNYSPFGTNSYIDETFEQIISKLISNNVELSLNEYLTLTDKFIATFNDSHTSFTYGKYSLSEIIFRYKPTYYAPLILNKYGVCLQVDNILIKDVNIGDTITKVNNLNFDSFVKSRYCYISCKPQSKDDYLMHGRLFFSYSRGDSFKLELNAAKEVFATCEYEQPLTLIDTLNDISYINDSTLLINAKAGKLRLRKVLKQLKDNKISTIHLDIGEYPDYKLLDLLPYLHNDTITSPDFIAKTIYSNGTFRLDTFNWKIYPKINDNKYRVFLHCYNAFSYGETMVEIFKYHNIGSVVGNRTIGTNGDVISFKLPIGNFVSTGVIVSRNGKLHDCIEPDIYVKPVN